MRRLLLFVCALLGFVACTQDVVEEQTTIRTDAPDTIQVGFEDDDTRIQLNDVQKTVWTKGDLASVFYLSNANQKWQYQGETGERSGSLKLVENATATAQTSKVVVVYPYRDDHYLNYESCNLHATLPATQYYAEGSYGVGSNLMVSQSEFTQFSLKSVCGWLKLQLTGNGEIVKSIKFRGNNGEQVAGLIYVDTATAEVTLASEMGSSDDNNAGGNLVFDDTILTEVTLDCGAGVELGAEATEFYISLPPQNFEDGFTVDIECDGYDLMTLSTENELVIERNAIQPMASVEHDAPYYHPNNEIWYTNGSTTTPTEPKYTDIFGANIVSNEYDANNNHWVITFDGEVTTIGDYAFYSCSSLTSVTIPDSVTCIGNSAFRSCSSLTSVTIPDSVTTIGGYAFWYCDSLTSVTIPDGVTTIGDYAFYRCSSLTSVTIPDSVTTIGERAFESCSNLTSVTIPDSVTTIGEGAFYGCSSLTSVTIPDGVTTIGDYAFYRCSSLTSVTIPDSVTTIGNAAFRSCSNLTSVTIPGSVTTIGDYAFSNCSSLTSLTIPNSVKSIGNYAFYHCDKISSLTLSDGLTHIGAHAFQFCDSLTEVTIPDSVTTIDVYGFEYCKNLSRVTLGKGLATIKSYSFYNCDKLTNIYCKSTTPPYVDYTSILSVEVPGRKIYVPAESVNVYKSASGWRIYANSIVGYDF